MLDDFRRIGALAWPVLVGQLAIIAFGVLDTAMVGRVSAADLAALGLGASIYLSVYIGLTGILVALSPIAGQHYGAKRFGEIGEEVRQSFWLALALTIIGATVLYFPQPLLRIAHAPPQLNARTIEYLRVLSFGMPASLCFRIYGSLSNAIARPRLVMAIQVLGLGCKVPLNLWFIFGGFGVVPMGGPGCALATVLINWLSALIGLTVMARHASYRDFRIFSKWSAPRWRRQWALLKLGIPMGLSYLIEVTAYTFMALFIARFGTTMLAGHQIAGNLGAVLYMTPLSIGIATSTLVAQALGADDALQARRLSSHGIQLCAALALVYAATVLALRPQIVALYTPDQRVAAAAIPLLTLVAAYHVCDALQVSAAFILRAYKVTVVPTLIYALALWGVGLGGGCLLGFDIGGHVPRWLTEARGFWFANSMSLGLAALGLIMYWRRVTKSARR